MPYPISSHTIQVSIPLEGLEPALKREKKDLFYEKQLTNYITEDLLKRVFEFASSESYSSLRLSSKEFKHISDQVFIKEKIWRLNHKLFTNEYLVKGDILESKNYIKAVEGSLLFNNILDQVRSLCCFDPEEAIGVIKKEFASIALQTGNMFRARFDKKFAKLSFDRIPGGTLQQAKKLFVQKFNRSRAQFLISFSLIRALEHSWVKKNSTEKLNDLIKLIFKYAMDLSLNIEAKDSDWYDNVWRSYSMAVIDDQYDLQADIAESLEYIDEDRKINSHYRKLLSSKYEIWKGRIHSSNSEYYKKLVNELNNSFKIAFEHFKLFAWVHPIVANSIKTIEELIDNVGLSDKNFKIIKENLSNVINEIYKIPIEDRKLLEHLINQLVSDETVVPKKISLESLRKTCEGLKLLCDLLEAFIHEASIPRAFDRSEVEPGELILDEDVYARSSDEESEDDEEMHDTLSDNTRSLNYEFHRNTIYPYIEEWNTILTEDAIRAIINFTCPITDYPNLRLVSKQIKLLADDVFLKTRCSLEKIWATSCDKLYKTFNTRKINVFHNSLKEIVTHLKRFQAEINYLSPTILERQFYLTTAKVGSLLNYKLMHCIDEIQPGKIFADGATFFATEIKKHEIEALLHLLFLRSFERYWVHTKDAVTFKELMEKLFFKALYQEESSDNRFDDSRDRLLTLFESWIIDTEEGLNQQLCEFMDNYIKNQSENDLKLIENVLDIWENRSHTSKAERYQELISKAREYNLEKVSKRIEDAIEKI